MKVLNLRCERGHGFEGWFASEEAYQAQHGAGLVECPLCADRTITRLPSAPRLNLSGARAPQTAPGAQARPPEVDSPTSTALQPAAPDAAAPEARQALQALWVQAVRHVMANTEDVGPKFAEEARRIHYGEAPSRGIRGQASAQEAQALSEEGIEVAVLPVPEALKGPLQ